MKFNSSLIFKLLILLVVSAFFTCIILYTYDLPKDDDFDAPLNNILALSNSKGITNYIKELVGFHADHRLVYLRLTSAAFTNLFGQYNFQIYAILNCLLLLPIFFFLAKPLVKQEKFWEILILSLVVFNLVYYDAVIFAHVSSTYTPVLFFAMLASREVSRDQLKPKNLVFCLLFCLLCLGCFGNGLFVLYVILLVLLFRKKYQYAAIWMVVSIGISALYFVGHTKAAYLESHVYFAAYFGKFLGFLSLMGSSLAINQYAVNQNILFGVVIALLSIIFVVANAKKLQSHNTYMKLGVVFLFCLTTLFVIAVGRVGKNEDYLILLQDRYRFYGVFTLATLLALYFVRYKSNRLVLTLLSIFFLVINLLSFMTFKPTLDFNFKNLNCSSYNYKNNGSGLLFYFNSEDQALEKMQNFTNAGFYKIQSPDIFDKLGEQVNNPLKVNIELKQERNEYKYSEKLTVVINTINIDYPDFIGSSHRLNGCYFLLKSKDHSYIFPSIPNPHNGRNIFKNGIGVKSSIRKNFLANGTYHIAVVEVAGNEIRAIKNTNQTLTI